MDLVTDLLVFVHLLGMAALFGGAVVQMRGPRRAVNGAMLYGILTQVVSGLLLVGVLESGTAPVDHARIGVKFALAVVTGVLVVLNRNKRALPTGLYFGITLLVVATVAVAVFW